MNRVFLVNTTAPSSRPRCALVLVRCRLQLSTRGSGFPLPNRATFKAHRIEHHKFHSVWKRYSVGERGSPYILALFRAGLRLPQARFVECGFRKHFSKPLSVTPFPWSTQVAKTVLDVREAEQDARAKSRILVLAASPASVDAVGKSTF